MTAGQLSDVLGRAADLIAAAGGKAADVAQVRQLAERLEPFAAQPLADFGDFLAVAAGHAVGDLRAYYPKLKLPLTPKPINEPKLDPAEQVAAHARRLQALYDQGLEPGVTTEVVDAALVPVGKLTVKLQNAVAAGCGFNVTFRKKGEAVVALRKWVLGRRGTNERAGA